MPETCHCSGEPTKEFSACQKNAMAVCVATIPAAVKNKLQRTGDSITFEEIRTLKEACYEGEITGELIEKTVKKVLKNG